MHDQPIYSGVSWSDGQSPQSPVLLAEKTVKTVAWPDWQPEE
jgi:hypothetical protein